MIDLVNPPPIRTPLQEGDTVDPTSKEWYYFWRGASDQINANRIKLDGLVTSGAHAERPDAGTMPEGALYVESDRGVIYQNQGGHWHYLAGTMWGTLSPDQRPTDLGVYDGGFDFRGTDQAREFIWSQTVWVEATEAYYGTHAGRPASAAAADGVLYIETDRGNVIYQQQSNAWHYVAGTMYGTISPDQRPTDLGANDAGFDFRGTDTQREFVWSGSAWNEVASRLGDVQIAYATATLTLSTTPTAIPGASLSLNRAGRYLITGNYMFGVFDVGFSLRGVLVANGATQTSGVFVAASAGGNFLAASQQWIYQAAAGQMVLLQAYKDGGTGSSAAYATNTSISAQWISP